MFNLTTVTEDTSMIQRVLDMVDVTMSDFEITKKNLEIIPATGIPEVVKIYLASKGIANLSMKTLRQYGYKLTDFFNTVQKSYMDIEPNDIRIYLFNFKMKRNASDSYVNNVRITLNSFFQWLVDNEYIVKNPCAKVDKIKCQPAVREPLTPRDLEEVRISCQDIREKALIDFLYSTGCRVSECAGVLLSDINWENNSVYLRHCKGGKERVVFFNDEAGVSMRQYLQTRGHTSDALWTSSRSPHGQLSAHGIECIIKKIGERSGIKVYPHRLRHTFATVGLYNGMPLEKVQALLGHASPQTTMIYAKPDRTQMRMDHSKAFS